MLALPRFLSSSVALPSYRANGSRVAQKSFVYFKNATIMSPAVPVNGDRAIAASASQSPTPPGFTRNDMKGKRVLIVGGVAGGASCAARLRRQNEDVEIVVYDRGMYVSFANCGLPYYVGNVITEEKNLLLSSEKTFKERFNILVKTQHEVTSIDRTAKTITVKDLQAGTTTVERYDKLVLAPGANPLKPPIPGIDLPGLFFLRTIPDSRVIRDWIEKHDVKTAVVVGGGFIGVEMAENLIHRGIQTTLVEGFPQLLPPMDPEIVAPFQDALEANGCRLILGERVSKFTEGSADGRRVVEVHTEAGNSYAGELVILGLGVVPNSELAKEAGLDLGPRRGIRVKSNMQTLADPDIYAVGDVIEVTDWVTAEQEQMPLAGPANRQGRIAADHIGGREDVAFRGVQGTAVCGAFGYIAACTGASEKTLVRLGQKYRKVYLHPGHHVGYYPGAQPINIKLLYDPDSGKVLGGQACGKEGTEKRVDVISMAIQAGMTVFDLEESELCYSPQFGAAKDPVNMAGFISSNDLRGDAPIESWGEVLGEGSSEFESKDGSILLDVREKGEYENGHVKGSINIPLSVLRERMHELPKDVPIHVTCLVGQRGYYGTRALRISGYDARNISGGMKTFHHIESARKWGAKL